MAFNRQHSSAFIPVVVWRGYSGYGGGYNLFMVASWWCSWCSAAFQRQLMWRRLYQSTCSWNTVCCINGDVCQHRHRLNSTITQHYYKYSIILTAKPSEKEGFQQEMCYRFLQSFLSLRRAYKLVVSPFSYQHGVSKTSRILSATTLSNLNRSSIFFHC